MKNSIIKLIGIIFIPLFLFLFTWANFHIATALISGISALVGIIIYGWCIGNIIEINKKKIIEQK